MLRAEAELTGRIEKIVASSAAVFLITAVVLIAGAPQGVDVTDAGFHLSNQASLYRGDLNPTRVVPLYLLSDIVGGAWSRLGGGPWLLWDRIGGALMLATIAGFSFAIVRRFFDRRLAMAVVTVASIYAAAGESGYIDYYSFPTLMLVIALWLIAKMTRLRSNRASFITHAIALGFVTAMIVMGRLPLALFLITPIALAVYLRWAGASIAPLARAVMWAAPGFVIGLGAVLGLYHAMGVLDLFTHTLAGIITGSGSMSDIDYGAARLFSKYASDLGGAIVGVGFVIGVMWASSYLADHVGRRRATLWVFAAAAVTLPWWAQPAGLRDLGLSVTAVNLCLILLGVGLWLTLDAGRHVRLGVMIIAGTVMLMISFAGSDLGLERASRGMWVILPLAICAIGRAGWRAHDDRLRATLAMTPAATVCLLLVAGALTFGHIYRDHPDRRRLTASFDYPALRGIRSTPERVAVMDSLLRQIDARTQPGDWILELGTIPLCTWATQTRPALGTLWLRYLSEAELDRRQNEAVRRGRLPRLIVYTRRDATDPLWPADTEFAPTRNTDRANFAHLQRIYLDQLGYRPVWQNRMFVICEAPEAITATGHHDGWQRNDE